MGVGRGYQSRSGRASRRARTCFLPFTRIHLKPRVFFCGISQRASGSSSKVLLPLLVMKDTSPIFPPPSPCLSLFHHALLFFRSTAFSFLLRFPLSLALAVGFGIRPVISLALSLSLVALCASARALSAFLFYFPFTCWYPSHDVLRFHSLMCRGVGESSSGGASSPTDFSSSLFIPLLSLSRWQSLVMRST